MAVTPNGPELPKGPVRRNGCPHPRFAPVPGRASRVRRAATITESEGIMPTVSAVSFGSHVEFTDHTSGRRDVFTLVEPFEAKVTEGRLSARSPVARALLGHHAGEVVTVHTPRGERQLEVIAVD